MARMTFGTICARSLASRPARALDHGARRLSTVPSRCRTRHQGDSQWTGRRRNGSGICALLRSLLADRTRNSGPKALLRELEDHARLWGGSPARRFLRVLRFGLSSQPYRLAAYRRGRTRAELHKARRHPWFTRDFLAHVEPLEDRLTTRPDLNTELKRAVERSPLPLYLRIEDRNSMAHSIEIRSPSSITA